MGVSINDIIYTLPVEPRPVSFREMFGDDHPVELEIGSGKGGFLLEQARAHEDRNFVGLEWANKYFKHASDRLARWGVRNVRMLRADAKVFVARCLPAESLSALHIYHPDPWPKKRHHKRRLFDEAFVAASARALRDGAPLSVQTDFEEYYEVISDLLSNRGDLEQTLEVRQDDLEEDDIVSTNFSVKYEREGREFWRLVYTRCPRSRDA